MKYAIFWGNQLVDKIEADNDDEAEEIARDSFTLVHPLIFIKYEGETKEADKIISSELLDSNQAQDMYEYMIENIRVKSLIESLME